MIRVSITDHGIRMDGHAGHGAKGQDIVCAAVSALTCSLANALENLTDNPVQVETENGQADIRWGKLDDRGRLLVDAWYLGIVAIQEKYRCIDLA